MNSPPLRTAPSSLALAMLLPAALLLAGETPDAGSPWRFEGSMPRAVLDRYLARSITYSELLHISWFAHQSRTYRDRWLWYAWTWIRETDPAGFLQMPGSRTIHPPVEGRSWYFANRKSDACPGGFGDEDTIREIWKADGERLKSTPDLQPRVKE